MCIYCRISDDREGRQNGVERQERKCRALADQNGDEIVEVFVDDDRSAYSGKPRPDYIRMLQYLRDGHADGAYALAPTRFYRRLDDGLDFFRLIAEKGLEVATVKQGRYDLSTADGRRDALRAAVDAQHESEQISERVRDAKADNLVKGEYRGGPRPFGYEGDGVTVKESEAEHVRAATHAVIAGDSLRAICRDLAAKGVRTVPRRYKQADGSRGEPEDREWTPAELRKMLLRPRNAGLMENKGEIVGKASWDPLVDEETWRACKAVLERPERRTTTSNGRVWLGSGLYRCGKDGCTETVRCSTSGTGSGHVHQPAYRCRTMKHVTRTAVTLDQYVTDRAIARLSRPDAAQLLLPPATAGEGREELAKTANALRAKLDGYTQDYAADLITRQQFLDGTALTRKRLEKVEAQMSARAQRSVLESLPLGTPEVEQLWLTFHLDKQRAIIDAIMTVTILPAKRGRPPGYKPGTGATYFDERAVHIQWKHES